MGNLRGLTLAFASTAATLCALSPANAQSSTSPNAQNVPESIPERDPQLADVASTTEPDEGVIVVTARKREELLIDVPQSVSVLSSEDLAKLGATQFRDFANTVPGLNFTTTGAGSTQVSMRGVTVGIDVGPTVGIYVDEVPYGASAAFVSNQLALDVGLFDLERIEVLRGPQGTLYGASSLGGLLKYVTTEPSSSESDINLRTGISTTKGGGISYNGALAVNVPIADNVAIRASGYYSHDGGFVDNLARNEDNVNKSNIIGGRADILLNPTDRLSVRLAAFVQDISREGEGTADYTAAGMPQDGSLDQRRPLAEPFDQSFQIFSGTISYDFDDVSLTSISAYQNIDSKFLLDVSAVYVPLLLGVLNRTYSAVGIYNDVHTEKFTQEIRLSSEKDQTFEWLIGGFFTDESSDYAQEFVVRDANNAVAPNDLYTYFAPSEYREYAAFGNVTWSLTEKLDLIGGLRYTHNRQTYSQIGSGLFVGSRPASSSSDDILNYLGTIRYSFSDRATGYFRYATGYRPGGPNVSANDPVTGLPLGEPTFKADKLSSFELGFKGEADDGKFGIDAAAYHIDWNDIQISVVRGGFGFIANAPGGATVRGAELSLSARPAPGFTATGAFAFQDAKLSEADPDLGAAKGERLPNVPKFTAAVSVDQEFRMEDIDLSVGATLRYVSDRTASFDGSSSQYQLPDYASVDLRAGLVIGSFSTRIFVLNLLNERGQLSNMFPQFGSRIAIQQPRTIGLATTIEF